MACLVLIGSLSLSIPSVYATQLNADELNQTTETETKTQEQQVDNLGEGILDGTIIDNSANMPVDEPTTDVSMPGDIWWAPSEDQTINQNNQTTSQDPFGDSSSTALDPNKIRVLDKATGTVSEVEVTKTTDPKTGGVVYINKATGKPVTPITAEQEPPVADFEFSKPEYVAGQEVMALNTSVAVNGKQVVQSIWMIDMKPATKASLLSNIFKTPRAGSYLISLKVKDNKGIWSDWTTKTITIQPNMAPVVTGITSDKEAYAQGESIALSYTYENEDWEYIAKERWTYRGINEDKMVANSLKPEQLFTAGEYIVTLSLEDAYGNISATYEHTLKVTDEVQKRELRYKFGTAWQGAIIDNMNNFNYQDYQAVTPITMTQEEGTLIMCNSPEQASQKGIYYTDTVTGKGRMIIHHINNFGKESNTAENKKYTVIAKNNTTSPITLTIRNKAIKGPVYDVLTSGQEVLNLYLLNSAASDTYQLAPGQKVTIYTSAPSAWGQGRIISGLFDFESTGYVTFTSAICEAARPIDDILTMNVVPRDGVHNRGTFKEISRTYVVDLSDYDKPTKLVIGNQGRTEWVTGVDATTGEVIYNMGNYGLSHYVKIIAKENTGVMLNPRGGVYRGSIGWDNGNVVTTPVAGSFVKPVRAATLGVVEAGKSRTLEYILPNGSAAPILFGFIPESYWDKEIGEK